MSSHHRVGPLILSRQLSCAFVLLSLSANVGGTLGPFMGGMLADPVQNYPSLFGKGSILGGVNGVQWMSRWPYALPNLVIAGMCSLVAVIVFLCLDEVCTLYCGKVLITFLVINLSPHSRPCTALASAPTMDAKQQ